jgi:hypothetical protein
MARKVFLVLSAVLFMTTAFGQELGLSGSGKSKKKKKGECAGYSTRDATALSMMGWGLGLGVGIATLCALIPNNTAESSHAHSH